MIVPGDKMNLTVKNELVRNLDGKIKFWQASKAAREHYQIAVWVEGPDTELDSIEQVEYILHPTFKRSVLLARFRANKFRITFWTWGLFTIRVRIYFKTGEKQEIDYFLTYELPPDDGTNYQLVVSTSAS